MSEGFSRSSLEYGRNMKKDIERKRADVDAARDKFYKNMEKVEQKVEGYTNLESAVLFNKFTDLDHELLVMEEIYDGWRSEFDNDEMRKIIQ